MYSSFVYVYTIYIIFLHTVKTDKPYRAPFLCAPSTKVLPTFFVWLPRHRQKMSSIYPRYSSIYPKEKIERGMISVRFIGIHCICKLTHIHLQVRAYIFYSLNWHLNPAQSNLYFLYYVNIEKHRLYAKKRRDLKDILD